MELKLEVYSPALELLGLLEIQRSVIWESKAFSAGSFSLESLITEESRALLVPENIIWIEGDTAGIIEHVEQQAGESGPYITVKGRDLTGILDRRILWGLYDLNAPPPAVMHHLVQDNAAQPTRGDIEARKIPGLVLLDAPAGGKPIRYQKTGGSLLEALELLGEAYQVAFGVRFNAAVPRMEFWTRWGVDRSISQTAIEPVFYSTELDDVLESEYSYDSADYRNVTLVAGEGEGKDRVMVTVEGSVEPEPQPPTPPEPEKTYMITLSVDPEGGGTASGGGTVSEGASVTVTASPAEGYEFSGWREGTEIVSTEPSYTFQASADRSLTAVFEAVKTSRLPDGYTEVEYIHSNSKCGINTGKRVKMNTTGLVMDIEADSYTSGTGMIFYAPVTATPFFGLWRKSSTYLTKAIGNGPNANITTNIANKRLIISYLKGVLDVGGIKSTAITLTTTTKSNAYLFMSSSGDTSITAKLYSAQMYEGNALVRDWVPCIDPTGVVGLYDLVEGKFYKNSWSGSFTAGPAV